MTGPPPKPLGMSDFFALEAGEYLERLDGLLAAGDSPNADELVRLARALRGSALMANHHAIARTAAALESLARAVREGRRAWDPQTKQLAVRGVDDLKIFVRRAPAWSDGDTAKAEALAQELEQLAGRPSAQVRAAEALGLDAGARAFVAREGAAIASALDRAAQALRVNPLASDPLQHVLRALQPLRGLAAVHDPARAARPHARYHLPRARQRRRRLARRSGGAIRDRRPRGRRLRRRGHESGRHRRRAAPRRRRAGALGRRRRRRARGGARCDHGGDPRREARSAGAAAPPSPFLSSTRPSPPAGAARRRAGARDRRPGRVLDRISAAVGRRDRRRVAGRAARRPGDDRSARLALHGTRAGGGRRPQPAVPRRPRAGARPGAAGRGAAGDRRLAPRPRRRSLRPRCPRPRAESRPRRSLLTAPLHRAGRGSWGSGSRSGSWSGRCTASMPATWWKACAGRTAGSSWRRSRSRPSRSRSARSAGGSSCAM